MPSEIRAEINPPLGNRCTRCYEVSSATLILVIDDVYRRQASYWCDTCVSEHAYICSRHRTYTSSRVSPPHICADGTIFCGSCAGAGYCRPCGYCNREFTPQNVAVRNSMYACAACRELHPALIGVVGRDGWDAREHFGYMGDPPDGLFFGVELETSTRLSDPLKTANLVYRLVKDFALIKSDSSISDYGMEIVSAPMSFELQVEKWLPLLDNRPADLVSWKARNDSCGMHVHVTKSALKTIQIGRMVSFLNNRENAALVEHVAGRYNMAYCNVDNSNINPLTAHHCTGARYRPINLSNRKTIEFRIFRGTLRKHCFLKNIEFVHSMCEWSKEADNERLITSAYLAWLEQQTIYPNLIASLRKAGFYQPEAEIVPLEVAAKKPKPTRTMRVRQPIAYAA